MRFKKEQPWWEEEKPVVKEQSALDTINELADTYCTKTECLNSMVFPYTKRDCPDCRRFGAAFELRKTLFGKRQSSS